MNYPECEKMKDVQEDSQKIGEFLDWLLNKRGLVICKWEKSGYFEYRRNIEELLAEYFGIDLNKVEKEKRQMLDEIRSQT